MMTYWFITEMNVPIVIACIPTIKPLVAKVCPRLLEPGTRSTLISDGPKPPTISSGPSRTRDYRISES